MKLYEILILANPEITTDETTSLEQEVEKVLKKTQAQVKSFERWGKYRLAFPVNNHDYGVYFLVRFETKELHDLMHDIQNLFKVRLPNSVMRFMVSHIDADKLFYQKPESLEDMPSDIDPFIREKGLLKKTDYRGSRERTERFVVPKEPESATQDLQESIVEE